MKYFSIIILIGVAMFFNSCEKDETVQKSGVRSIFVDSEDVVWVGTYQGLKSIKNGSQKVYDQNGINGEINFAFESGNSTKEILVATTNGVYSIKGSYDTPQVEQKYSTSNSTLVSNEVNTINSDHLNRDWFGTIIGANYEKEGELIEALDPDNFLKGLNISSIAFLYDSYFFGTYGDNMLNVYYDPETDAITGASHMTDEYNGPLTTDTIFCVIADSDTNAWYGSSTGLTKSHRIYTHVAHEKLEYFLEGYRVYSICLANNGNIWAGTDQGLFEYNFVSWKSYTSGNSFKGTKIFAVDQDSKGNIWIGTDKGVSEYDGSSWKNYE